ncbi:hypothetical protein PG993_013643 [Apiospora rasikravindrae]|uniref:Uncharacterized protein n=1 Tax=Apiospora rasikravindrae TaxID=990691 RepID=A0ABR1RR64_9PEZI
MNGHVPNALWNKIRVAAQPPGPDGGYGSRVVRVTGNPSIVNEGYMLNYFSAHFHFDLECAPQVVHRGASTVSMEFAFAAYINQAENAYHLITQDRRRGFGRGRGRGHGRGRGGNNGLFGGSGRDLTIAKTLEDGGFAAIALWNKVKVPAQPPGPGGGSRVVRVTGNLNIVNEEQPLSYFAAHFHFEPELDGAPKLVYRGYASASMDFAFAAFVNQSENAYRLLRQDGRGGRGRGRGHGRGRGGNHGLFRGSGRGLTVAYVRDPCEEDEDNSA